MIKFNQLHPVKTTVAMFSGFFCVLMFASCSDDQPSQAPVVHSSDNLQLVGQYPLPIPEPSGMDLAIDKKSLWLVSDSDSCIYQISLNGDVLRKIQLPYKDLEGIAVIDDQRLAVVSERSRKIVEVALDGTVVHEGEINVPGTDNAGPEALAYNAQAGVFYILKEGLPGLLITMDRSFKEIGRADVTFARDYSSVAYDPVQKHLWILSDLSKAIYVLDLDLNIKTVFSTNIPQKEGIAVDYLSRTVYIVSDKTRELYVFTFDTY